MSYEQIQIYDTPPETAAADRVPLPVEVEETAPGKFTVRGLDYERPYYVRLASGAQPGLADSH